MLEGLQGVENIFNYAGMFLIGIGVLAFLVTVITEVTKTIGILNRIPTNLHVLLVSVGLTISIYFSYLSYTGRPFLWGALLSCVLGGYLIAYIAMYGWDKLHALWGNFYRDSKSFNLNQTSTSTPNNTNNDVAHQVDQLTNQINQLTVQLNNLAAIKNQTENQNKEEK
jgi:hypothetical protein